MHSLFLSCAFGLKIASSVVLLADAWTTGSAATGLCLVSLSLVPLAWIIAGQVGVPSISPDD